MKQNKTLYTSIASVILDALKKYASMERRSVVTDIYLQPNMQTGELSVFDDDDELLSSVVINEWNNSNPEEFQTRCELALKKVLNQLFSEGEFSSLPIMEPYSFVMVDSEKETLSELMIVDEEETLFLNDELLKGLDDELNAFLKDLLEV
jgi:hypothetical protein